jgi:hypothetical protein
MAYILKNTSGLVNTRITDIGRQKISQGNFNITYFQVGDSEVSYNAISGFNQTNSVVLEPAFNSQNGAPVPQANFQNVKYPYYVDTLSGATYGIPFMDSIVSNVYNVAPMRGFFSADTTTLPTSWSAKTGSEYVKTGNYYVDMSTLNINQNTMVLNPIICNTATTYSFSAGDFVTIYYDGLGLTNCNCTYTSVASACTTVYSPYNPCPPVPPSDRSCFMSFQSCSPILTYRIISVTGNTITVDRKVPNYVTLSVTGEARALVYPSGMTNFYDSATPEPHWNQDVLNFESVCDIDLFNVNIWNMNIPWSESPAGLNSSVNKDYTNFGSVNYLGSKEYFGYSNSNGQTDSDSVYYYNSLGDKIIVPGKDQKAIAIVHYTNNTIDFVYGEKFALQPYDPLNETNTVGMARNFRFTIPWLQWHKSSYGCCSGQTFYVDPPNIEFEELGLFQEHYLTSNKNTDMNNPGHRYYHLWDTNPNIIDGYPNRIGKVFPDLNTIVIDDEEIIAAMSYKSNRNWTLPAPRLVLSTPNGEGVLTGNTDYMYVTYRFSNSVTFTNSLHCNYYSSILGPNQTCNNTSQDVAIIFGNELGCLGNTTAYNSFEILCQKVAGEGRPTPTGWKKIDVTSQLSATTVDNYITTSGITGTTLFITKSLYDSAPTYNLNDYVTLPTVGQTGQTLNFGDEYYFYGNIETEIQATIYEMRWLCNLNQNEFNYPSNPTWTTGTPSYITEVALYDNVRDLMAISKLQSPIQRQSVQQFLVKLDI